MVEIYFYNNFKRTKYKVFKTFFIDIFFKLVLYIQKIETNLKN